LAVFVTFHSRLQADLLEKLWWFRYMTSDSSIDIREVSSLAAHPPSGGCANAGAAE
jgi:hypothetical protein